MRMRVRMVHDDSGGAVRLADKTLLFMMLFDAKNAACYIAHANQATIKVRQPSYISSNNPP